MSAGASVRAYGLVLVALLGLTAITIAVAYVDLGWLNTPLALAIAGLKAAVVAIFFMHLNTASALDRLFAVVGLFFMALLIGLTLLEHRSREDPSDRGGAAFSARSPGPAAAGAPRG